MPFNSASDAFQLHPDVAQVTAGPNAGRSAGVVAELDAKKIDRNYVTRARWLFFWSIVIPVCAMSFFMSETFKKEWADPDAPDTDPGALEEDFNIVRAYFNARCVNVMSFVRLFDALLFFSYSSHDGCRVDGRRFVSSSVRPSVLTCRSLVRPPKTTLK